jgi:hypothetical protein
MKLQRWALFAVTLTSLANSGIAADLTTAGGKKISGTLVAVDSQGVTVTTGDAKVKISGKDLLVVDLHNAVAPIPKDKESGRTLKCTEIELTDGSIFRAAKFALKGKQVVVEPFPSPQGVESATLDLPMSALFSVIRDAGDAKHREAWKKMLATRGKRDLYVIREPDALNFVQGTILAGNDKGDEILFEKDDGSQTQLRQSRAGGYVFAQVLPKDAPPILCKVVDVFGNNLVAQAIEMTPSGVTVRTVSGVQVKYSSIASLVKLDYSRGNVAYLSDLETQVDAPPIPVDEKELRLNVSAPYLRDQGIAGESLKLGTESFPKGVLVAPDTAVTYTLNGDYREFKAVVGIPENTPDANLAAKVIIEGDGRPLFSETIRRKEKPKGINLDVKGVKVLRVIIEADFAVNGNRVLLGGALVQK